MTHPQTPLNVLLIIFFSIFVLYLSSSSSTVGAASPALCNGQSINKDFCLKTLDLPEAATATNVKQFIVAVMKIALARAQTTLNSIGEMSKKPNSPATLAALKICEDSDRYAVQSFRMIPGELDEDAQSADYDICVIGPEVYKCVQALIDAKVSAPQISQANKDLMNYSSLGAALSTQLH